MTGSNWVRGLILLVSLAAVPAAAIITPGQTASVEIRNSREIKANNWYTLEDGTEISVIRFSRDGRNVEVAVDNGESDPSVQWVTTESIQALNPKRIDFEALEGLADLGLIIETVSTRKKGGMTYCLRDVRIRATRYTAQRNIPQGIPMASIAYKAYRAKGWKKIEYSARVPNGTACFSGGGRPCGRKSYCGHAAIKIGANQWLGAGVTPTPWLRDRRDNGRVPYKKHGCLTPP